MYKTFHAKVVGSFATSGVLWLLHLSADCESFYTGLLVAGIACCDHNQRLTFMLLIPTQGEEWLTYNLEHDQEEDDAVIQDEEDASDLEDEYNSDVEHYISFQR